METNNIRSPSLLSVHITFMCVFVYDIIIHFICHHHSRYNNRAHIKDDSICALYFCVYWNCTHGIYDLKACHTQSKQWIAYWRKCVCVVGTCTNIEQAIYLCKLQMGLRCAAIIRKKKNRIIQTNIRISEYAKNREEKTRTMLHVE